MSTENEKPQFSDDTVVLGGDPLPDLSLEDMKKIIANIKTTEDLVEAFVIACYKYAFKEDETYDYEEGTEEYEKACAESDAWRDIQDDLVKRCLQIAKSEGLMDESLSDYGWQSKLERFMNKYGYYDGSGWWIKKDISQEKSE